MHWRLSEASAIGVVGASQIEVFPSEPARAARWQLAPHSPAPWEIAALTPHPAHASLPDEVYSRQNDLIVRYPQGPADTFSYQLDWQLFQPRAPFIAAIELWLSVQTNLLDTEPELEIACSASSGQSWQVFEHPQLIEADSEVAQADQQRGPAALLCGPATNPAAESTSGLWLIEPTDQCHASLNATDDQATQRVHLFRHFMEKGVIRRARMRFLLAPSMVSAEQIKQAYRDLADSPLPLTA